MNAFVRFVISVFTSCTVGWMVGAATQYVYGVVWMVLLYSAVSATSGYALCWVWLKSKAAAFAAPAAPAEPVGLITWRELRTHAYGDQLPYDVAALRERVCRVEDRLVAVETRRVERQAEEYRREQP